VPRCHLTTSVGRTTLKYLNDSVTQVYRAERVEKRVDAGVDVGQPERDREQLRVERWMDDAHDVDEVVRHPADDVPDDEERQRHEPLAFSISSRFRI